MKVLITGGSHTGSLVEGQRRLEQAGEMPPGLTVDIVPLGGSLNGAGRFWVVEDHRVRITLDKYRRRVPLLGPRETPYDAIGFSSPYYSRTLWSKPDWRQFGLPSIDPARRPLSKSLLRRAIRHHQEHLIEFMADLQQVGFRVFAIDAPRPFRHNPAVARVGAAAVQAIDALYREQTRAALEGRGLPTIATPVATYDADGFTLPLYRHEQPDDHSHGNGEFGVLLMREVLAWLQQTASPSSGPALQPQAATA